MWRKDCRRIAVAVTVAVLSCWHPFRCATAETFLWMSDRPAVTDSAWRQGVSPTPEIQFQLLSQPPVRTGGEERGSAEKSDRRGEGEAGGEPEKNGQKRGEEEGEEEPESEEPEDWYPGAPRKLEAEFADGFALASEDEEFELKFHVLNQVDYKTFRPADQEPAGINGVYIPRMRIYLEGKLTDPFRYEISLQRSVEGAFDLLDANLDIRFAQQFQLRLGRTLIPYSYTWYDHLEQYFIVPERPLFPLNFGLSRAAGVQLWGEDDLRRWQYSVGWYDGRVVGLADNNTTSDAVGYINLRPFAVSGAAGPWENFNFGGSLVVGENKRPAEALDGRTSIQSSENDEAANAASSVFLELNPGVVGLGDRLLGAIHSAWYFGPVSLEAEWNALSSQVFKEEEEEFVDLPATGFHVTLASFLTGERVRGREAVEPLRPFEPRCHCPGPGAWEPFVRFSYLRIGKELFERELANPEEWTDEVAMTDVGINWYMNRFAKFYFDWQHAEFASPVLVNAEEGKFSSTNDLFWLRCQLYF